MPIYLYACPDCGERREIFLPVVPKDLQTWIPCQNCDEQAKLQIGVGVISRYGPQWVKGRILDASYRALQRGEGDLGMATETQLKAKYARHIMDERNQ